MTNEEAFVNFINDYTKDKKFYPSYEETWQAAIAYMQEQNKSAEQSEPVAWMEVKEDAGYKEIKVWQEPVSKKSIALYTTPQRVEPSSTGVDTRQLKRLDKLTVLHKAMSYLNEEDESRIDSFANAIMDAMQELNK